MFLKLFICQNVSKVESRKLSSRFLGNQKIYNKQRQLNKYMPAFKEKDKWLFFKLIS